MDSVEVHDNFGSGCDDGCFRRFISSPGVTIIYSGMAFFQQPSMYGYYTVMEVLFCSNGYYQIPRVRNISFINCEFHHNETRYYLSGYPSILHQDAREGDPGTWSYNFIDNMSNIDFTRTMIRLENTPGQWFIIGSFSIIKDTKLSVYESDPDDPKPTKISWLPFPAGKRIGQHFLYDTNYKVALRYPQHRRRPAF